MPGWRQDRVRAWTHKLRAEDGSVLTLTAFGLVFLIGFLALAVDTGRILFAQRQIQTFADAAALAGALEISTCGSTSNCTAMQNAAKSALTENSATGVTLVTQCGTSSNGGIILMVNNGPCYVGSKDPNNGSKSYVEVVVSYPVTTFFATVLGKGPYTVKARAEAGGGTPAYCGYILSPSASDAFLVNGSATIDSSCGFIDDSDASPAAIFNGGDTITTSMLNIVGTDINNGSNTLTPAPTTGATAVPDPLSSLATPSIGSCGTTTGSPYTGGSNVVVNSGSATFNPGVYCGGITINGSSTATFNAGTYIVEGNMIVNGGDTVSGNGVTFYFSSGSLTMNGGSHADFVAPTTGTYAGILYFQSRTDSSTVIVNGDTTSVWQGVIYAPDANLTLNGGSNLAAYTDLVVNTLTVNGGVNFTLGDNYSSLPGGSPITSNSSVSMVE
jgi:Flp pilus assembly protein TadG